MIEVLKQWAEDVSKVYDILAFGHTERALEILAKTRTSLRQAIAELESQYSHGMYAAEDLDKAWKSGYDNCKDQYAYLDKQEPVAWMREDATLRFADGKMFAVGQPFYTHPPQRTEQEPVAYLCENAVGHKYFRWKKPTSIYKPIPLYTYPPQRTWQGLTDEEIWQIATDSTIGGDLHADKFAKAIEAKLKERNG